MNPIKKHSIEYACVCNVGKIRRNNEDNFYCGGHIREDIYSNDEVALSGMASSDSNELFAVFDGMGGEACGEVASYIAAGEAKRFAQSRGEYEEYLYELAQLMNNRVVEETEERSLVLMGSTAAMLQLRGGDVYVLNAGDSRVYKRDANGLRQISVDHIVISHRAKAITEFLGMPNGATLAPYIASGKIKAGDLFLLCSDGVTDMLSDTELDMILSSCSTAEQMCRALTDTALDKGGIDNITAIVLRVLD